MPISVRFDVLMTQYCLAIISEFVFLWYNQTTVFNNLRLILLVAVSSQYYNLIWIKIFTLNCTMEAGSVLELDMNFTFSCQLQWSWKNSPGTDRNKTRTLAKLIPSKVYLWPTQYIAGTMALRHTLIENSFKCKWIMKDFLWMLPTFIL